ncbi:MAG: hypothetical protein FWG75_02655 [Cystobacterineae bacterium]|nr:hypothetical protein [Cystobacterineae bacterium]
MLNRVWGPWPSLCGVVFCVGALLGGHSARAARPMITDDARTVDAKACQVETWLQNDFGSTEYWALPACNFSGTLELTLGGALNKESAKKTQVANIVLQGKTLFKALEPNGWSVGMAFGYMRRPLIHTSRNLFGNLYAYIPASFAFFEERLVMHLNLGWLYETLAEQRGQHRMSWGMGSETQLSERSWLIAEIFGQNKGRPFYQVGLRLWLVPEHVQLDATFGDQWGKNTLNSTAGERWFSIGLRLLSPPFLP